MRVADVTGKAARRYALPRRSMPIWNCIGALLPVVGHGGGGTLFSASLVS